MGQSLKMIVLLYAGVFLSSPTRAQNNTTTQSRAASATIPATSLAVTNAQPSTSTASSAATRVSEASDDFGRCTCDLTSGLCDVNCCCDPSCNRDDRLVFSTCTNLPSVPDSRRCVSDDLIATTNLDYRTVTERSDNLFCIYTDNNPARNFYTTPDLVDTKASFDALASAYGRGVFGPVNQKALLGEGTMHYKESDPIVVVYPPDVRGYFGFPQALTDQLCDDGNPAGFLQARQTVCQRRLSQLSMTCLQTPSLAASTYYSQFQVAMTPSLQQQVLPPSPSPESDENTTTPTVQTLQTLSDLASTTPTTSSRNQLVNVTIGRVICQNEAGVTFDCTSDLTPEPFYNRSSALCENVISSVSYTITHNTTEGITAVVAHLMLMAIPDTTSLHTQRFDISFVKDGASEGLPRSGNPGYIVGLPVLAGRLVTNGQQSQIELSRSPSQWLTVPQSPISIRPSSVDCVDNPLQQAAVNFGQDTRSGCLFRISRRNISQACTVLQSMSRAILSPSVSTHIGVYGNVLPSNTADWVQILPAVVPPSEALKMGSCSSVRIGLHLEVLFANTGPLANPQAKIVGASWTIDEREVIFQCVGQQCQAEGDDLTQAVELTSSVSFVDVSTAPQAELKKIPDARADLPHDFFYPFLQGGTCSRQPSLLVIVTLSLFLLLQYPFLNLYLL